MSLENAEYAAVLRRISELLEIAGESPFRIRAYRAAAETIEELAQPLEMMIAAARSLEELPGIGKATAAKLTELHATGRLGYLEELERKVPGTLLELLEVPGLGPRRVRELWLKKGIESLDQLEDALEAGNLEGLPGFGARLKEKALVGVREVKSRAGRTPLHAAEAVVAKLLEHLGGVHGVQSIDPVGSYRRRSDTVGALDLLVTTTDSSAVMERFAEYPGVHEVAARSETQSSVTLRGGQRVTLRLVKTESRGAALQHFTGAEAHLFALEKRAETQGLTLTAEGLFRGSARIAGATEDEVYAALGMSFVPPELREDRGEVAAAASRTLPELVVVGDIRGDMQMHSTWSDGKESLESMVRACRARGYEYMAVTDHSKAVRVAGGLQPDEFLAQFREIDAIRERIDGIRILKSGEIDILGDGSLDVPQRVLEQMDLALVSVHSKFALSEAEMTKRITTALRHPKVRVLGHPTGRLIGRREPYAVDIEQLIHVAREEGVLLELNANPHRLDLSDVHVRSAREAGVGIVISTDAHSPAGLDDMRCGVDQARRGWLEKQDVANTLPLAQFLELIGVR